DPFLLVHVRDHLDVRARAQPVTARLELPHESRRVVDLAVADHLDGAVLVPERLLAAVDVDDREAPHPERHLVLHVAPEGIRPAVHHDVAHRAHAFRARPFAESASHLARDPAHGPTISPQAASRWRSSAAASSLTGASRGLIPRRGSWKRS